jgi:hypothetical protein
MELLRRCAALSFPILLITGAVLADSRTTPRAFDGQPSIQEDKLTVVVFPEWPGDGADSINADNRTEPGFKGSELPSSGDQPIFPPDVTGERGYTEAEVAHFRSNQPAVDPAMLDVVPPDEDGFATVNQAEMQYLSSARAPLGPDSLVLPPGENGEPGITAAELDRIRATSQQGTSPWSDVDFVPPD